jgi:CBS domain containing-hemolysin-like protein
MTLLLISLALALGVSFCCSVMEAVLLSLTPGQVVELERTRPRSGAIWKAFKADIDRPITVILLLNTTAHTIGATIAGAEFAVLFGDRWIGVFSAVFTFLMLQYTEILPKTLGVRFNGPLAGVLARPLDLLCHGLSPVVRALRWLNRPFERRHADHDPSIGLDEIPALAAYARLARIISPHQEKIIARAATLSRKTLLDVMVPAAEVTFLSSSQTLHDAVVAAHMDPHTRFPVTDGGDHDRILGYVNFKELVYRVRTNPANPTLRGIIRPVRFLSSTATCDEALRVFIEERAHVAIVRDPEGRTAGLATLEDVVEELLGPRETDFERLPRTIHPLAGGVWMVGGGAPLPNVAAAASDDGLSGAATMDEWIRLRLGHAPTPDARVKTAAHEVWVRRVRRGLVFEALVGPLRPPPSP